MLRVPIYCEVIRKHDPLNAPFTSYFAVELILISAATTFPVFQYSKSMMVVSAKACSFFDVWISKYPVIYFANCGLRISDGIWVDSRRPLLSMPLLVFFQRRIALCLLLKRCHCSAYGYLGILTTVSNQLNNKQINFSETVLVLFCIPPRPFSI